MTLGEVDGPYGQHMGEPGSEPDRIAEIKKLRDGLAAELRTEISGMSPDNFLVRPHRRYVEKYATGPVGMVGIRRDGRWCEAQKPQRNCA